MVSAGSLSLGGFLLALALPHGPLVPQKLGSPFGVKPKSQRRKDLLLATSKENTGDLSLSSISLNSKIGDVLS